MSQHGCDYQSQKLVIAAIRNFFCAVSECDYTWADSDREMFCDIEWSKKGNRTPCMGNRTKIGVIAKFCAGTFCDNTCDYPCDYTFFCRRKVLSHTFKVRLPISRKFSRCPSELSAAFREAPKGILSPLRSLNASMLFIICRVMPFLRSKILRLYLGNLFRPS